MRNDGKPTTADSATRSAGGLSRRRAIRIVAAAAGLPLMIAAVRATAPSGQLFNWQGEVLGAVAEVSLWHTDAAVARRALAQMRGEIARYERISAADTQSIGRQRSSGRA